MARARRIASYAASAVLLGCTMSAAPLGPRWPTTEAGGAAIAVAGHPVKDPDETLIEERGVCVGSRVWSAGDLGHVVLYRYRREGHRLFVGYFVYWSTERPWGRNALTFALAPAIAIDAVYSHFLFVLPGVQAAMYGPGDVEGAMVAYDEQPDRTLVAAFGVADDEHHRRVDLSPRDLADPTGRPVLLTNVWSHQLGARGAAEEKASNPARIRCFGPGQLHPLTADTAATFRLGDAHAPARARPAWRLE